MDELLTTLTVVTALGCGLNGGILFAFSSFVMPALASVAPSTGVAAMQAINVKAIRPPFMTPFLGTAVASIAVAVAGLATLGEPFAPWLIGGGAAYLVGVIGLTGGYHVPRNDALARVDPAATEAAAIWDRYVAEWTRLNHVRAAAGVAAAAALTIALLVD